jgi:hypothetical protein
MNSEIIQNVTYDNYYDFQYDNFIFSQKNSFHYFEDYLMMKLTIALRYVEGALTPSQIFTSSEDGIFCIWLLLGLRYIQFSQMNHSHPIFFSKNQTNFQH